MAYCTEGDLLLGDMSIGTVDTDKWIDAASDEMDSKLGFLYALPLAPCPDAEEDELLPVEVLLLKDINAKLASGRLILAQYVGGEDSSQHAYGVALVREALEALMCIANGDVQLTACKTTAPDLVDNSRLPAGLVYDEESLVTAFERTVHRGVTTWADPGPTDLA